MGFVTRRVPAYEGVRRIVKLVLGGRPSSGSLDFVSSEHMMGRALPYLAVIADYFFIGPAGAFGLRSTSDVVRLITGILAAAAVIQFVHVSRRRQLLLRRRK